MFCVVFVQELLTVFRSLEQKAKVVASDTSSPLREVACRFTQVLSAAGQLGGWRHVEEFITDQDAYRRRRGPPGMMGSGANGPPRTRSLPGSNTPSGAAAASKEAVVAVEPKGKIEQLTDTSEAILRAALMRSKWVLEIEKKAAGKEKSDGKTLERILGVLLKDGRWMNETAVCSISLLCLFFLFFFFIIIIDFVHF